MPEIVLRIIGRKQLNHENLGKVRVPVLYIGAAGGFGPLADCTKQLLGSKDVHTIADGARSRTKAIALLARDAEVSMNSESSLCPPFTAVNRIT